MTEIKNINTSEALRYMGYRKEIDIENIKPILKICEEKLISVINPRYVYKIYDIEHIDGSVHIVNSNIFLKGNDIYKHTENCNKAVFMAATLSASADRLISSYEINDMSSALITDAMASAAVEQLCNNAEEEIKNIIGDYYMTWRFSPGYGDLDISCQKDFILLTDATRKIGLTLNSSNILIPRKSVTAIIGLSAKPLLKRRRGCAVCSMNKICEFRKRGDHCGF